MAPRIFQRLLRRELWPPYTLGWLGGIPLAAILVLLRDRCAICWFVWVAFSMFLGWGVFWRTPRRKAVAVALIVGTFGSFLVLAFVAIANYGHR